MKSKSENPLKSKSYSFALRIVNLYKYLSSEKKEYILSKQVLRSGTGVGALIHEAPEFNWKHERINCHACCYR